MAAERQSGMLELCQNYAGAMRGFLDPFQKRPRPNEDYQLSPLAHALFLRPILGVCGAPVRPPGNGGAMNLIIFAMAWAAWIDRLVC